MFSKILMCCVIAFTAGQVVENNPPQPYSFGYDNTDEFGTRLTRQETGDEFNGKVGSYSYTDAAGVHRTVNYVADAAGFRATVDTNEPGTKTSEPADAPTLSAADEGPHPIVVDALKPAPVVVQAVHAAPVPVQAVQPGPLAYAQHSLPIGYTQHVSPVVYEQQAAPVAYSVGRAPFPYPLVKRA